MPDTVEAPEEMDSIYSDEAETPESPKEEATETVDEESAESNTAVVDNKVLSPDGEPLKEGDEIVLKVVKNYGGECEVTYAPKKGGSEKSSKSDMDSANEELDAMNTKEY